MGLGYKGRREQPPLDIGCVLLGKGPASFRLAIDGMLNTVSLPTSQVEFEVDGGFDERTGKPRGRVIIPQWLAKKEGIIG